MSVFAACALVALKLGTGLAAGSPGLVSAGIEWSGDVVAAILTVFAIPWAVGSLTQTILTAIGVRRTSPRSARRRFWPAAAF
jgi:hypothetical protein